jgi:hypothetical protein
VFGKDSYKRKFMRISFGILLGLGIILTLNLSAQDQIIYLNGDKNYVDKIEGIENDTLIYISFKKTRKAPLKIIEGYYLTINTKENLKRGYYRRDRTYHEIDKLYHESYKKIEDKIDYYTEYLNERLPKDLSSVKYRPGYYIDLNGDTLRSEISIMRKSSDNFVFIISRTDSSKFIIHPASKIIGYSVNESVYESLQVDRKDGFPLYCFIEKEISGKLSLYYKPDLPYLRGGGYLISFHSSNELIPTSIFEDINTDNSISDVRLKLKSGLNVGSASYNYRHSGVDLVFDFRNTMSGLLQDCPSVASKIKAEFYKKSDLRTIAKEYNKCVTPTTNKV